MSGVEAQAKKDLETAVKFRTGCRKIIYFKDIWKRCLGKICQDHVCKFFISLSHCQDSHLPAQNYFLCALKEFKRRG